jgi:hypothetical protein
MSYIFVDIPHHTAVYGKAKKSGNTTGYFVYREMMIAFGRFLGVLVLLVTGSLVVGFIIGGVGMATWFFI